MNQDSRRAEAAVFGLRRQAFVRVALIAVAAGALVVLGACGRSASAEVNASDASAGAAAAHVGVVKVGRKTLERRLTVSSELVPFQETDVYAKESGFVKSILVDYGTRVRKGQLMAVLEIPELEAQLRQDDAMTRNASDRIARAQHELDRAQAQHHVLHLQAARLSTVSTAKPGLVAEQEVDDAKGKDLASESAVESAKSNLEAIRSDLLAAKAKREHDGVLLDYAKITAPFAGTVTQRFANLGMLMQAGTNSSTQAMPLVRLSQDDLFRLVIPVPETYVRFVRVGDPVEVTVPALGRKLPGKVARFSVDVKEDTRTMHTEVDVPNSNRLLMPGMYAEAIIRLEQKPDALFVPLLAVNHAGDKTSVYVITPAGKVEDRSVALGLATDSDSEVVSGLHEGEMIAVGDRSGLKAGQTVQPQVVDAMQYQGEKEY
jgi:RND family efflux transporter MFP subunit